MTIASEDVRDYTDTDVKVEESLSSNHVKSGEHYSRKSPNLSMSIPDINVSDILSAP